MKSETNSICAGCGKGIRRRDQFYECAKKCCLWCDICGEKAEGHGGKYRLSSKASLDRILKRHALVARLFK
jgi:hypothetical protein